MDSTGDLRIELFGGFRILTSGRSASRLPSVRQQELVALLVLQPGVPIPRQRIAACLWPDSSDAQALTNLRREIHHLRDDWPVLFERLDSGTRTLTWTGASASVDVVEFEAACRASPSAEGLALAAGLYRGELLPDCTAEWIESPREQLRQRATAALTELVALLERQRDYGEAVGFAQQLCRLDPLNELAWCALMRCHAQHGERAAALHAYQQCSAVLKKELGVQPSAATRATYRSIVELDASIAPAAPTASPPQPRPAFFPFVGRQREWESVVEAWTDAGAGRARLCLIRGEAGIGKTRLAEELVEWCASLGVSTVSARCYAGEGRLAFAPLAAWLASPALQQAVSLLDLPMLADVARLRPEVLRGRADAQAPAAQLERWQRVRFFDALAHTFRSAAPLLMVLDDLQWADADTVEWIRYFLRSAAGARCLVVATIRAEEEQDNPALAPLLAHLQADDLLRTVNVGPLDRAATVELARAVAGQPLDAAVLERVFSETEGHPLFIVERGRMEAPHTSGPEAAAPRVQSVVAARLALLSEEARAVVDVAAAVGRDFQFDILAHASDLEEDALVRALDELWQRHIVRVQADERWDFSHDRFREVAYAGIAPARRRLIHRRIAQGMELIWARRLDEASASIAVHLDRGGQPGRAVPFLQRAAEVATHVSAYEEAIRCLTYALSLLARTPAGRDRDHRELELRAQLSVALNLARGYAAPEVEENLARILVLSSAEAGERIPARWLWVAFTLRFMLGDLRGTREVAERALSQSATDPSCRCDAHHAMGGTLSCLGELHLSRVHFEAALAEYDERRPQRSALGSDLGVFAHAWYAHTLWLLGEDGAALRHGEMAVELASRLEHLYSEALAHAYLALLQQMRGDTGAVTMHADAAIALCDRYGFAYYGDWAQVLRGWAVGHAAPAQGVTIIEAALARLDARRAQARRPYYLSLLADTLVRAGSPARAAAVVDDAVATAVARADAWWLPALYAQKGGESARQQALALARVQGSRALEARIMAGGQMLSASRLRV